VYQAEEPPAPAESGERKGGRRRRHYFHLPPAQRAILKDHDVTRREPVMHALGKLGDTPLATCVARMLAGGEHRTVGKAVLELAAEAARLRESGAPTPAADTGDHGKEG
jgi:hypothetical protein